MELFEQILKEVRAEADSSQGESWEADINLSIIISIDGVSKGAEAKKLFNKFTDFLFLSKEFSKIMNNFEKKNKGVKLGMDSDETFFKATSLDVVTK